MAKSACLLMIVLAWNLPLVSARERATTLSPERQAEADQLIKHADSLMARKLFEDAALEYQKALAINSKDPVAHNKLGIAYHQLQDLRRALKEYQQARKLNPKYHEAWNNLGTVHYSLRKYKKAVKNYRKALEINPDSATTYHNMGAALFAMKRYEEGFVAYQEAYRLDPSILERISNRGTIIKTAEANQGMQNFYFAKLYLANGQPEKALAYLLKALETGFTDYKKITGDPAFKVLAQDERVARMISPKAESLP